MAAILSRVLAAVLGGYALIWSIAAFGMTTLVMLGVDFHDAEAGMFMLAFLIYPAVFLWAFAARSQRVVWLTLMLTAPVLLLSAFWLQQRIIT